MKEFIFGTLAGASIVMARERTNNTSKVDENNCEFFPIKGDDFGQ